MGYYLHIYLQRLFLPPYTKAVVHSCSTLSVYINEYSREEQEAGFNVMKKYIFLTLLTLCISISSFSQIQRKVLGFTLGITTKTAVASYLKTNHIKYSLVKGEYCAENVRFAGVVWEYVWFTFYNGKLYNVDFSVSDDAPLKEIRYRLEESLKNKYSIYYNDAESTRDNIVFSDGIVEVGLRDEYSRETRIVSIMYTYLPILDQSVKADNDEL